MRVDCDDEITEAQYRVQEANMLRSLRGRRGQALARRLLDALDALPEKRLYPALSLDPARTCLFGALAIREGHELPPHDPDEVVEGEELEDWIVSLGCPSRLLAWELVFRNDEYAAPEKTFENMRRFLALS